jgi:hypothetical protein
MSPPGRHRDTPPARRRRERDDGIQLLYRKRWHTNIGFTGSGKTIFALWHIKAALDAGGHVIYLHS